MRQLDRLDRVDGGGGRTRVVVCIAYPEREEPKGERDMKVKTRVRS